MSRYIVSCDPASSLDNDDLSYVFVYDWKEVKDKSKDRREKIERILKDYSSE